MEMVEREAPRETGVDVFVVHLEGVQLRASAVALETPLTRWLGIGRCFVREAGAEPFFLDLRTRKFRAVQGSCPVDTCTLCEFLLKVSLLGVITFTGCVAQKEDLILWISLNAKPSLVSSLPMFCSE